MKDILKRLGVTHIYRRKITSFVGVLDDDEVSECLSCKHEGKTHAEYEVEGSDEAEVVCPECGSCDYFVKDIL